VLLQKGGRLIIRPETSSDYGAIREINVAAFANHPYSHQTEHLIVDALRAEGALSVSLVAEDEGTVVGHIAFSPVTIDGEDPHWFTLGPVAVLPEMQRKGIGTELVRRGLDAIRGLGAQGCVLVGDPAFYHRFGFVQSTGLAIDGVPPEVMLSLSMTDHTPQGKVEIHPGFFVQA
jgi:putative acetyltransferase